MEMIDPFNNINTDDRKDRAQQLLLELANLFIQSEQDKLEIINFDYSSIKSNMEGEIMFDPKYGNVDIDIHIRFNKSNLIDNISKYDSEAYIGGENG